MPQKAASAPHSATEERLHRHAFSFRGQKRVLYALWIIGLVALFCLHFPHLLADFPNYSPWMDYSKYTDEGWYANAAIRYHLTGHWYLRGDFNPAVALPVWPLLLAGLFHFTGVSLGATRSLALFVFGLNLLLVGRIVYTRIRATWVALVAVTILVTNPFLFAFSRLALLEPLLITILLLTWLLALRLPRAGPRAQTVILIAIGILLWLLILTKTTALFILPSTLFLIAHACAFRLRAALRALAVTAASAILPWCLWYLLLVRPHYRIDYYYLFTANEWAQPTTFSGWVAAFWYALHGVLWISPALCALAIFVLLLVPIPRPSSPATTTSSQPWPLIVASLFVAGGYIFFSGWHNSPQPRYYEIVIYPLAFVLALGTANLFYRTRVFRLGGIAALLTIATVSIDGVFQIADYLRHSEYTWFNAAEDLTHFIDQHPGPNRLLLAVSGDEVTLLTHLPAICDDYGTWDLPYRIHTYHPGWFATWNDIDPGTLTDLEELYSLERVAQFPAFDDPDRNLLILYRLHPLPPGRQKYETRTEAAENSGK